MTITQVSDPYAPKKKAIVRVIVTRIILSVIIPHYPIGCSVQIISIHIMDLGKAYFIR